MLTPEKPCIQGRICEIHGYSLRWLPRRLTGPNETKGNPIIRWDEHTGPWHGRWWPECAAYTRQNTTTYGDALATGVCEMLEDSSALRLPACGRPDARQYLEMPDAVSTTATALRALVEGSGKSASGQFPLARFRQARYALAAGNFVKLKHKARNCAGRWLRKRGCRTERAWDVMRRSRMMSLCHPRCVDILDRRSGGLILRRGLRLGIMCNGKHGWRERPGRGEGLGDVCGYRAVARGFARLHGPSPAAWTARRARIGGIFVRWEWPWNGPTGTEDMKDARRKIGMQRRTSREPVQRRIMCANSSAGLDLRVRRAGGYGCRRNFISESAVWAGCGTGQAKCRREEESGARDQTLARWMTRQKLDDSDNESQSWLCTDQNPLVARANEQAQEILQFKAELKSIEDPPNVPHPRPGAVNSETLPTCAEGMTGTPSIPNSGESQMGNRATAIARTETPAANGVQPAMASTSAVRKAAELEVGSDEIDTISGACRA
ncbi:hypothetical protein DFH07DRAFT_1005937 [Mycena maculata]|uniref:Uncharacterized protein n=1 Tax=Mycena maculata TaxID=230809 RepID=A0AAD7HMB4_9AGAR|nr:hypothetical protein DFH07DRAFT_1005937 [Mycena maculata]